MFDFNNLIFEKMKKQSLQNQRKKKQQILYKTMYSKQI